MKTLNVPKNYFSDVLKSLKTILANMDVMTLFFIGFSEGVAEAHKAFIGSAVAEA